MSQQRHDLPASKEARIQLAIQAIERDATLSQGRAVSPGVTKRARSPEGWPISASLSVKVVEEKKDCIVLYSSEGG
ncbi:hypothetical protein EJ07DRAFT_174175 [Lizonia empirigonia]|nr:hypothetical protein EJ07DRAFT_174175 [Lizonia empirigonia]